MEGSRQQSPLPVEVLLARIFFGDLLVGRMLDGSAFGLLGLLGLPVLLEACLAVGSTEGPQKNPNHAHTL